MRNTGAFTQGRLYLLGDAFTVTKQAKNPKLAIEGWGLASGLWGVPPALSTLKIDP